MANFQGQKSLDIEKIFWSKVDNKSDNECWEWKEGKFGILRNTFAKKDITSNN